MAETDSSATGFFWGNDPRVNQKLRERIALQMLANKRAYPKTIGEGLSAIGDSLGEIGTARRLEAADLAAQAQSKDAQGAVPAAVSFSDTDTDVTDAATPPPVQTSSLAPPPQQQQPPPQQQQPPPQLASAFPQPQGTAAQNVANALVAQQMGGAGGPQPNPTMAGAPTPPPAAVSSPTSGPGGQPNFPPSFLNANAQMITPAPKPPQITPDGRGPLATAPDVAVTGHDPQYIQPERPEPGPPRLHGMSPREAAARLQMKKYPGNDYVASSMGEIIKQEQAIRAAADARNTELWKKRYDDWVKYNEERRGQVANAAKRGQEYREKELGITKTGQELSDTQEKSVLQSRLGGRDPQKFFDEFQTQKQSAVKSANVLTQAAIAREAIDAGVITGTGAGWRVNSAKLQDYIASKFGVQLGGGQMAARTEQMEAAIKSMLAVAIENIQGGDSKVSDSDIKVASQTIGADPTLQLDTIKKLVANNERLARTRLGDYEDQKDYYLGGTRAERMFHVPVRDTAPAASLDHLLANNNEDTRRQFDEKYGPGAADLEIARAKRRSRRGN